MSSLVNSIKSVRKGVVAIAYKQHNVLDNSDQISVAGTGFLLSKEKLLFCTCAHVVTTNGVLRTDAQLQIGIVTEQNVVGYPAQVVSLDLKKDLAVLNVPSGDQKVIAHLEELRLGDSKPLEQGEEIAFLGFPFGMVLSNDITPSATKGIISAFRRDLTTGSTEIIQLDAVVGGGNSGAPVFLPETSEVIAIVKGRFDPLMKGRPPKLIIDGEPLEIFTNIGIAQPINVAKDFLLASLK